MYFILKTNIKNSSHEEYIKKPNRSYTSDFKIISFLLLICGFSGQGELLVNRVKKDAKQLID